ncbi:MAG TPA: hypothetical protein PKA09_26260, partial [Geminicoccus sp.]|nr:hypothetical protein [Geminicoccus sp.]
MAIVTGPDGSVTMIGGNGKDLLVVPPGGSDYQVWGLGGNDVLRGGNKADTLWGGDGIDTLAGNNGDDLLRGDAGADKLDGGNGIDTADYTGSAAVVVDLAAGTASGGHAQGDKLSAIENLTG